MNNYHLISINLFVITEECLLKIQWKNVQHINYTELCGEATYKLKEQ